MASRTVMMDPLLLYLPSRVLTTLHKNDLHRIEDVASRSRSELLQLNQVGYRSANEIIGLLMDFNIPPGTSLPELPLYTEYELKFIQRLPFTENKLWKAEGVETFCRGSFRCGGIKSDSFQCTFEKDHIEFSVSIMHGEGQIECSCGNTNCTEHPLAGLLLLTEKRRRKALPDEYASEENFTYQPLNHDPLFWLLNSATRESILKQGILWTEELSSLSANRIKQIPGIGPSRLKEIKSMLDEVNLKPSKNPTTLNEPPAKRFPPDLGYALRKILRSISNTEQGKKLFRDDKVISFEQNSQSQYTGRVGREQSHKVSLDLQTRNYECSCPDRTSRKHCSHQLAVFLEAAKNTRLRILSGLKTEEISDNLARLISSLEDIQPAAYRPGKIKAESDDIDTIRYYLYRKDDSWSICPSNSEPDIMRKQSFKKSDGTSFYVDPNLSVSQKDRAVLNVLSSRFEVEETNKFSKEWADLLPLLAERNLYIQDQYGKFQKAIVGKARGRAGMKILSMEDGGYRMNPFIQLDEKRLYATEIELISTQPIWIRSSQYLYSVSAPPVFPDLLKGPEGNDVPIRKDEKTIFAKEILPKIMDHQIRVEYSEKQNILKNPKVTGQVYLSEQDDEFIVEPRFQYGSVQFGRVTEGIFLLPDPDGNEVRKARRNVEQETEILEYLRDTGLKSKNNQSSIVMEPDIPRARWMIEERPKLEEQNIDVIARGDLDYSLEVSEPSSSRLSVRGGINWFKLEGQIEFEKQTAKLRELMEAVETNEKYVQLSGSTYGKIPDEVSDQLSVVNDLARSGENNVQLPGISIGNMNCLLDNMEEVNTDETFKHYRKFYRNFDGIDEVKESSSFHGSLRPYQRAGLGWLQFLRKYSFGGLLADDMGLGKTVQILAHLQLVGKHQKQFPHTLVVCPRSVLKNWKREANHFLPDPNLYVHHGSNRIQVVDGWPNHHLSLTTYGTMRSDVDMLKELQFDTIVLDESHVIRNPDTKTARAIRLLVANHRIGLSGTPVQNTAMDLWSQFQFLNPGLLGDRSYYEETFVRPIEDERDDDLSDRLQRLIHPFLLRRTKDRVEKQLPELTRSIQQCPLFPEQKELYETYRQRFRKEISDTIRVQGVQQSRFKVLEGLTRLRQICCHPALVEEENYEDAASSKMARFIEQVNELINEGHRALVFSQFVQFLNRIRRAVEAKGWSYEYLEGSTKNREQRVRRFQSDESIPLFLISLKAGGEGLNLTGANYVFLMDPWWNPAVEQQAMDRSHRIGQDQPVFVYRFICPGTIEEKMLRLQARKEEVADDVITPEAGIFKDMDRGELINLFS